MMFMLLTASIAVITVLILLKPLFIMKGQDDIVERDAVNVQSARKRLSELKQELADGLISEQQFQDYRHELETDALEDLQGSPSDNKQENKGNTVLAILLALLVPLLSLSIYQKIGNEQALQIQPAQNNITNKLAEIDKLLSSMEADLVNNPDDLKSWIILGQAYFELERYEEAMHAYENAYRLSSDDADIMVNYAEAIGRATDNDLGGEAKELLNKALGLMPNHQRALWLAGFSEMQSNNKEGAIHHWRHLLSQLEPDSEVYRQVASLIDDVVSEESSAGEMIVAETENAKTSLMVKVSLATELQGKVDADTSLFVFARASEGPPMPLAVYRATARELPLTVTLDDTMAMMPEMSLSRFSNVIVGARLSTNGQPQGQAGDFEGYSEIIETGSATTVDVIINTLKP